MARPWVRWLSRIGIAIAIVVPTGALLWAVWCLWSLLAPQWDPRTILAIVIVAIALLAVMWWRHGWLWLLEERDPITWVAMRARLPLTTLPLPKTNGGRLGLGFLLLLALLWYASGQPDDKGGVTYPHASLINPILGGLGALFLIYAAIRQACTASDRHQAQTRADLQRRFTETFSKAVEQLGDAGVTVRVGGIYTLERLAGEALTDTDKTTESKLYWTVIETLTAFVRERARSDDPPPSVNVARFSDPPGPATDIAAALTVIGRRPQAGRDLERDRLDLSGTRLAGANLTMAHLENVNLNGAHLEHANLTDAPLEHANLIEAHLEHANLTMAHLEHANLARAHLESASLKWAHLESAILNGAHLARANLWEAHLEGAIFLAALGLTQVQIDETFGNSDTTLPFGEGLTPPKRWPVLLGGVPDEAGGAAR